MTANGSQRVADVLPPGTVVGAYVIQSILGAGGFGVTYRAEHRQLGKEFALKEYFPRGYAHREGTTVSAFTNTMPTYQWGLDRFLQEARALARFHHRAIVGVSNVFEANGTAYMVLSFETGRDMRKWRADRGEAPTQTELDAILGDLLDALSELHHTGLIHRDIAPDNIYIRTDGTPVLLDFGAARHAIGEHSTQISAIVKSGYSPPEQYSTESKAQGPWSDIYAMGATLYAMVNGRPPPESAGRLLDDSFVPAASLGLSGYRPGFLEAIDQALELAPARRPRSVDEWRTMLLGAATAAKPAPTAVAGRGAVPLVGLQEGLGRPPSAEVSTPAADGAFGWLGTRAGLIGLLALCAVTMAAIAWMRPAPLPSTESVASLAGGDAVARCDAAAAIPQDPAGRGGGVALEALDAAAAIAVCSSAADIAGDGDLARVQAQLGYALRAAGRLPDAARALKAASDAGHAEAQSLYGDFLFDGVPPVAFDRKAACTLYERAMQTGSASSTANFGYCVANGAGGLPRDERRAVALYRQAAEKGSRDGMLLLGVAYRDGLDVPLNVGDAIAWLDKAAALGEARASYVLADLYNVGYGVPLDRGRAREHAARAKAGLERMAAHNHLDAIAVLAAMHRDGDGIGADPAVAARLYQRGADLGGANAMGQLADLYARGSGVTQDLPKAMALLEAAIARDNDSAMLTLGILHEDGRGTAQNYGEAMRWYRRAAERGNGQAMDRIANLFYDGRGVTQDQAEALRWFRLAAERGTPSAMNSIGVLTELGHGRAKDPADARRWYQRAADLGNADAMRNLGQLHEDGVGVAVDGKTAEKWYVRAVERDGDVVAMHRLGELFRNGTARPANVQEAVKWYRRAVEKDHAESMAALGILYAEGNGVEQSHAEAARLYKLGADKGSATAMYLLASLYEAGTGLVKDCAQARLWYGRSADAGDADAKAKIADKSLDTCR